MASIYVRGGKLWARLKNESGKWIAKPTPYRLGEERQAKRYAEVAQETIDKRRATGAGPATVRAYAKEWLEERRKLDLDWKNDRGRLEHHVLPIIGHLKLSDIRTRHIVDLFRGIRTNTERPVAQRTVYNIYSVVSAMFRDARLADRIEHNPCELDERQLGPVRDKNPEWRAGAVFTRDEATTIISTPDIPRDRQMVYGLELLAGVRPGEAAALRWRHYDATVEPLGKLLVSTSYNTRKHKTKSTKTDSVRHVPVHPTLAAMLAEWKLGGWPAMMGRTPEPDDLIVPLPPEHAARRRSREGDAYRGHDYSGKRWREEDLPALEWRHRRHYDMRATLITLALDDGADPHVIETRITHTKKSRSAFDGYNRGRQWEITCAEIAKLKLVRRTADAKVIALPLAKVAESGGGTAEFATVLLQSPQVSEIEAENRGGGGNRTRGNGHEDPRNLRGPLIHAELGASNTPIAVPSGPSGTGAVARPCYSLACDGCTRWKERAMALVTAVLDGDRGAATRLARELRDKR